MAPAILQTVKSVSCSYESACSLYVSHFFISSINYCYSSLLLADTLKGRAKQAFDNFFVLFFSLLFFFFFSIIYFLNICFFFFFLNYLFFPYLFYVYQQLRETFKPAQPAGNNDNARSSLTCAAVSSSSQVLGTLV